MASGPITSWQTEEEKVEAVTDFIFLGSKITVDGDWSHEIKRRLLLGREAMTNLDNILKSKGITLSTKVCLVKAMVFAVIMHGCESWTIKKAECWRIHAFELWCWRRLLRVLWTTKFKPVTPKGNQPWLFIGKTDAKAEAPNPWPPYTKSQRTVKDWCWGGLRARREGDNRGWDGWMAWLTQCTWVWVSCRSCWWTVKPGFLQSMGLQRTELNCKYSLSVFVPASVLGEGDRIINKRRKVTLLIKLTFMWGKIIKLNKTKRKH